MHSIIKYGLLTLSISTATFFAGLYYGFDSGAKNYYALESVLSANFDVANARRLKSGTVEDLNKIDGILNLKIDNAVDQYNWYQESGNKYLSQMFFDGHIKLLPDSIMWVAKHRKKYPEKEGVYELVAMMKDNVEDKEIYLSNIKKRLETIERYSKGK